MAPVPVAEVAEGVDELVLPDGVREVVERAQQPPSSRRKRA
jgi:hypothetical protein